jgi:hypothetical protein
MSFAVDRLDYPEKHADVFGVKIGQVILTDLLPHAEPASAPT